MKRLKIVFIYLLRLLSTAIVPCSRAEVTLDGSTGYAGQILYDINSIYSIPYNDGYQLGNNLLFSFSHFNIGYGESAYFNVPDNILNIIARVTGGTTSNIDGTIQSVFPNESLWLINPSGFIIGPHASINPESVLNSRKTITSI